jgi:branched-chain amino acid transport system permease protein
LLATVMGGTGAFFGPVIGAVALVFFSVGLASFTRAWLFYLGLFFIVIVAGSPDGIASFAARAATTLSRFGWRAWLRLYFLNGCAVSCWTMALVLAVQWAYATQASDDVAANPVLLGNAQIGSMTSVMALLATICVLIALGWFARRYARQVQMQLERGTEHAGDAR